MSPDLIHQLLAPPPIIEHASVEAWWAAHRRRTAELVRPIDRAFLSGLDADRLAWPFAGGYAAALSALQLGPSSSTLAAFAVTEAGGNHPKAIETTLIADGVGARISGHKRWVTLGERTDTFLVVTKEITPAPRPSLKVVKVRADAPGVRLVPLAELPFVPEIPHAELILDDVAVDADAILPGDGYARYVKPFRTVEDLHVHGAIGGWLLATGSRQTWPQAWRERLLAALFTIDGLAALSPSAPEAHVALAGALSTLTVLVDECSEWWRGEAKDRWLRDRALFAVAGTARAKRRARAWDSLTAGALESQ